VSARPLVIALVGLRGAGKSAVGRRLAARLGWPLVDTDEAVCRALGVPVAELLRTGQEARFRDAEEQAVADALAPGPVVLATGGGAVLRAATRARLAAVFTVWLEARPEVLLARTRGSDRPPLTGHGPLEEIHRLAAARAEAYAACAHMRVDTSELTEEAVCDVVEHAWRRLPDHDLR